MTEQDELRKYLGKVPIETDIRFCESVHLSDRDVDKILKHLRPRISEDTYSAGLVYYGSNAN